MCSNSSCGLFGGFSLVLDIVMVFGQFSGCSKLLSKSVLSSSSLMSHCIYNGSGSLDFNK